MTRVQVGLAAFYLSGVALGAGRQAVALLLVLLAVGLVIPPGDQ